MNHLGRYGSPPRYTKAIVAIGLMLTASPALADPGGIALIIVPLIVLVVAGLWVNARIVASTEARVEALTGLRMTTRLGEVALREVEERQQTLEERRKTAFAAESERKRTALETEAALKKIAAETALYEGLVASFGQGYLHGRRWLIKLIAETHHATDTAVARRLDRKKHPAHKAAEELRLIAAEKRDLLIRSKELEYTLRTLYEYYPQLEDYADDILDETASVRLPEDGEESDIDRVAYYLSKEEYDQLEPVARNQLALDKWKARSKSNGDIGRMYERFIGYKHEQNGWDVAFPGAILGRKDLGRDLICTKGYVKVIQAKCWAAHKMIHEKHIFQLYGTSVLLRRESKGKKIEAAFYTTIALSEPAQYAAKELGVKVVKLQLDKNYPLVKCNVNGSQKIYHLPFDQQYDRVKIVAARGECYVATAKEAERKGFRRAQRFGGATA